MSTSSKSNRRKPLGANWLTGLLRPLPPRHQRLTDVPSRLFGDIGLTQDLVDELVGRRR